jgi:hypothetical protein
VRAVFEVGVLADGDTEGPETFVVRATDGRHVNLADPTGVVTILPPVDASGVEPGE